MSRTTQWFSACSQPATSRPTTTTTTTTTAAIVTTAPPVVTTTMQPSATEPSTRAPPNQCSDAFSCELCVQRGCQFCYDSVAFTLAVPGVCSANCSLVTPRSADAPIVSLEQPAHCASLDDFIKSKEEEANTGTGGISDTTVLHYCLLPSTTCPRCVNRIGCYWCSTGYCVHDTAMCDVPLLLQSETACPERMTTGFNNPETDASATTAKTGTGLADLLDIESIETWQLGLAIGGALLVCLLIMSLIFVCYLRHLKKKQQPNVSARSASTVHIFSDDTTFPSATFGNGTGASFGHNSGASFGNNSGASFGNNSGAAFGQSTMRGQQQVSYGQGGTYGQGITYGNPYY
jgi:hypothetical protein